MDESNQAVKRYYVKEWREYLRLTRLRLVEKLNGRWGVGVKEVAEKEQPYRLNDIANFEAGTLTGLDQQTLTDLCEAFGIDPEQLELHPVAYEKERMRKYFPADFAQKYPAEAVHETIRPVMLSTENDGQWESSTIEPALQATGPVGSVSIELGESMQFGEQLWKRVRVGVTYPCTKEEMEQALIKATQIVKDKLALETEKMYAELAERYNAGGASS